jgi:hypothetical protein
MHSDQRKIVELQKKKVEYMRQYSQNLLSSILKSKYLELIENNTLYCLNYKKNLVNLDKNFISNCLNKRVQISDVLIEVFRFFKLEFQ